MGERNKLGTARSFWTFVEWAGIDWSARKGKMRCDKELPWLKPYVPPPKGQAHPVQKGLYKIKALGVGKTLHGDCNNDKLVTTRFQTSDEYSRFMLEPLDD